MSAVSHLHSPVSMVAASWTWFRLWWGTCTTASSLVRRPHPWGRTILAGWLSSFTFLQIFFSFWMEMDLRHELILAKSVVLVGCHVDGPSRWRPSRFAELWVAVKKWPWGENEIMWWMWTCAGKCWDTDPKMGAKGEQYIDVYWYNMMIILLIYIYRLSYMYTICCMIICICINIDIVGPSYLGIHMDLGSPGRFVHHRRFPTLSRATRNFSASQLRMLRIGGSLFTADTVGNSWNKMGHLLTLIP